MVESLDPTGEHKVGLKWPNDVWVNDSKLVGILIETALPSAGRADASRYLVIGIGINIGPRGRHRHAHAAGLAGAVAPRSQGT